MFFLTPCRTSSDHSSVSVHQGVATWCTDGEGGISFDYHPGDMMQWARLCVRPYVCVCGVRAVS